MKSEIKKKIADALATRNLPCSPRAEDLLIAQEIAARVVAGEEETFTLKEAAQKSKTGRTSLMKQLRGRPGYLQLADKGTVLVTKSLLLAFMTEAASRGLSAR